MPASRRAGILASVVVLVSLAFAQAAHAATTISRAELNGTQVRIEGSGATPNAHLVVNDGALTGTADSGGGFRISSSNFSRPADCKVTVTDGSTSATRTLSGCTVSQPPPTQPPPTQPPPSQPPPSQPPPSSSATLSALSVSPTDVVGGDPATGTVTISGAAPTGGFVVDLQSDNTTAATVPPSVTVPAGSTRATFPVTTNQIPNAQSAMIIGTVGGVWSTAKYGIITVWDAFHYSHGSVSILPGGNGSGHVTSQPAGVDCTITNGSGSGGTCNAFFPVGTVVRLSAQAAPGSRFRGFVPKPGCVDASNIKVARGTTHTCQVGFSLN